MKTTYLLPLATASSAFIIPDDSVANELRIEPNRDGLDVVDNVARATDDFWSATQKTFSHVLENSRNVLDEALAAVYETGKKATHRSWTDNPAQSWLGNPFAADVADLLEGARGPTDFPHFGHGHHGDHGGKPNLTIYQLIQKSKYTTKLAKLIDEEADLVIVLNSTAANYTVFAPTDHAFEKISEHGKKPSPEDIKKTLLYHISPELYPACRVLLSHTIPTLLKEKSLGGFPQRIRRGFGLKGLELNFYSRVVAVDVFATNGVIHGIDDVLFVPGGVLDVIDHLPAEFSTLQLGLIKTGLWNDLEKTATSGQTFFAPSNLAFFKLGPKINAFLFGEHGLKYLKAILKYHVVSNQTMYSDAFYDATDDDANDQHLGGIPKGLYHFDFPTLLDGHSVSVDIARYAGFISIKINGFVTVLIQDGPANDGVIHLLSDVLIPPKKLGDTNDVSDKAPAELTVDELKERLDPYIGQHDMYEL